MEAHEARAGKGIQPADLFLLFLLLFSLLGIGLRYANAGREGGEELTEYRLVGEWQSRDPRTAESLRAGDLLYTERGEFFGRVESVQVEPARLSLWQNGELIEGADDSGRRVDVRLEVSVMGRMRESVLLYKGMEPLQAGERKLLYTDRAEIPLVLLFCPSKS